jgi:hypothetical protein
MPWGHAPSPDSVGSRTWSNTRSSYRVRGDSILVRPREHCAPPPGVDQTNAADNGASVVKCSRECIEVSAPRQSWLDVERARGMLGPTMLTLSRTPRIARRHGERRKAGTSVDAMPSTARGGPRRYVTPGAVRPHLEPHRAFAPTPIRSARTPHSRKKRADRAPGTHCKHSTGVLSSIWAWRTPR